jgi:hypothetical protein
MSGAIMENETELRIMMTRVEGKIDLVNQAQIRSSEDIKDVRLRVHDLANDVSKLSALNIEERLSKVEVEAEFSKSDREQRKGAMAMAKAVWTLIGVLGIGNIVMLLRSLGVIHG